MRPRAMIKAGILVVITLSYSKEDPVLLRLEFPFERCLS